MSHENKQLELRRQIRSMVAEIHCYYARDDDKFCSTIGVFLVVNRRFCYLMVRRSLIKACGSYTIYLPDGSSMKIGPSEFVVHRGMFAGCYIYRDKLNYDLTKIVAARIGEDVIDFQQVHLCGFSRGSVPGTCLNVVRGRVLVADDTSFKHDCGPVHYASNGAPLFCDNGGFVGLCIQCLQGLTTVLNVSSIQENLNYIYDTQKIEEFYKKVSESSNGYDAAGN